MMTPEEKTLVRTSFTQVETIADQAGGLFYQRLFEVAPQYRHLFQHNIDGQAKKLMQTLGVAVEYLDRIDELMPTLHHMGRRHERYGVQPGDYDTVGDVLIWTLGQGLGDAFTDEVKAAWVKVYALIADAMKAPTATMS